MYVYMYVYLYVCSFGKNKENIDIESGDISTQKIGLVIQAENQRLILHIA